MRAAVRPALALVGAAAAAAVAAGIAAAAVGKGEQADTGVAAVATTGHRSELRETIPVAPRARGKPRVAMSLPPRKMPDLLEGDRLRVTAELQTTNNCSRPSPYCVSRPYEYSPRIGARLVVARRRNATVGKGVEPITDWRVRDCDQDRGNREHHCMRVFTGSLFRIEAPEALPCKLENCRINLVVEAHHPNARKGDVVLLGIDRRGGAVSGDRGRLNATRLRGDVPVKRRTVTKRLRTQVPVERDTKTPIYSMRLANLRKGEQLTFAAAAEIGIGHLDYPTFVGSQLILGTSRQAKHTTPFTQGVATLDGEVTEANGFNCTQRTTPCTARKVGTLRIRKEPRRNGRTVPLFVNFVLRNAPKRTAADPGDAMRVNPGGFIGVRRYPPRARG